MIWIIISIAANIAAIKLVLMEKDFPADTTK